MARRTYILVYDARCRVCRRGRALIMRLRPRADLRFVDIHDGGEVARYPQLAGADLQGQMHVIDPEGRVTGGYDAFVTLAPRLPAIRAFAGLLRLGPVRAAGRRIYQWVAANRYRIGGQVSCQGGACGITGAAGPLSRERTASASLR